MNKNDYLDFAERFTKYVTDINNMVGAIPRDFAQQIHDFCELAQRDYPLLREKYNKPRKMKYYLLLNITEVPSAEEIMSISSGNDKWEFLRKCAADLTLFNSEIADMYNLNAQQMERLNKIIAQSPANSAYSISVFDKIRQGREDEVIHSNNEHDRFLAATAGIGLDVLVHDESSLVRAEVAKQGYGLDILVHDVNSYVQIRVAEQGYGLDILKESEFEPLAMIANAMLVLQENNGKSFIDNDLLMHEFRNIPKEVFLDIHKDISSDDYDRTAFDVAERIGDHFDVNGRWIASKMLITDNAVNVMEIFRTRLSNESLLMLAQKAIEKNSVTFDSITNKISAYFDEFCPVDAPERFGNDTSRVNDINAAQGRTEPDLGVLQEQYLSDFLKNTENELVIGGSEQMKQAYLDIKYDIDKFLNGGNIPFRTISEMRVTDEIIEFGCTDRMLTDLFRRLEPALSDV